MIVDNNARAVQARELNDTLVGEPFSYENEAGIEMHGRIAFIEKRSTAVKVTLDGVIENGSSVVMNFEPSAELWFTPMG
ncbi:hypothetical protein [Streptomyces sp. NPDC006333]|uniref:hypothetical protein n=1 Tax=Streptomyces sp. NPDC006333 TaxID=3156753 RepID=UPI0033A9EA40